MKLIIEPGRAGKTYWGDIWRYRELMFFLAWRDFSVRYKQTVIGVAWALVRPLLTMLVFVGFRLMTGLHSTGVPTPILVYSAVLPWQLFSGTMSDAAASLIGNSNLISKVYFPRLIMPCAVMLTNLADFVIAFGILLVLMAWYGVWPGYQIVFLPVFVALTLVLAIGPGVALAALTAKYRDFRYIIPFLVQCSLFLSPIAFQVSELPARFRPFYELNPLSVIVEGFRWCISGENVGYNPLAMIFSLAFIGLLLHAGVWYFRRVERSFADVI